VSEGTDETQEFQAPQPSLTAPLPVQTSSPRVAPPNLGLLFLAVAAAAFLVVPRALIGAFTSEPAVLSIGVSLLFVGAIFQLFDGVQGVATGVLRGLGDTRTPMLWNLAGHWLIGLPLGYTLCFVMGLGVVGLWWGLSIGLIICAVALLTAWSRHVTALSHF